MNKNIKDYLHLYLGCECKWKVMGEQEWQESNSVIDLKILDRLYDRQPFIIAPILRPLSDMSEEEQTVVQFRDIGSFKRYINEEVWTFEHCRYLLSKHFDLFNLIPEGLAIDKTTLNQQ